MKRLVLIGAGHAHLLVIERASELKAAGLDALLIAPRWFHYSGMATGVLSGDLPLHANRIDVAALARRCGVAFVEGCAADFDEGHVTLEGGDRIAFDLLSINTGSVVSGGIGGTGELWPVKPLANLAGLRERLEADFDRGYAPHVVIAGAGTSGAEVAACIAGLVERRSARATVTLAGTRSGRTELYRSLGARGIELLDPDVVERRGEAVLLADGSERACDHLVAATGLDPHVLGQAVGAELLARPGIFAAGDCADFQPRPLPRHGVFSVREAPVLVRNLVASARGEKLTSYRPQRRWLSIMDLGNGEGFATWGAVYNRSRAALRLKRRLDLAFVRRFQ